MQAAAAESEKLKSDLVIRSWEGLLIGLAAGLIIWGAVQVAHPVFRVSKKFDVPSIGMPTEMFLRHRWEQDRVDRWNAALYLGGLGLLVSLAIGAPEGVARRSIWPLVSAPLGALGGAAGGMLGCMVLQQVRANIGQADLMHTIEAQLAVGVPLGLAVGLSAGLMTWTVRGTGKYALGGLVGGVVAAVAYVLTIALLMPAANTDALLPEEAAARLMWLAVVGGMIGVMLPIAGRRR
jgi:hypothetical protein